MISGRGCAARRAEVEGAAGPFSQTAAATRSKTSPPRAPPADEEEQERDAGPRQKDRRVLRGESCRRPLFPPLRPRAGTGVRRGRKRRRDLKTPVRGPRGRERRPASSVAVTRPAPARLAQNDSGRRLHADEARPASRRDRLGRRRPLAEGRQRERARRAPHAARGSRKKSADGIVEHRSLVFEAWRSLRGQKACSLRVRFTCWSGRAFSPTVRLDRSPSKSLRPERRNKRRHRRSAPGRLCVKLPGRVRLCRGRAKSSYSAGRVPEP
jgi:hypothetical protein